MSLRSRLLPGGVPRTTEGVVTRLSDPLRRDVPEWYFTGDDFILFLLRNPIFPLFVPDDFVESTCRPPVETRSPDGEFSVFVLSNPLVYLSDVLDRRGVRTGGVDSESGPSTVEPRRHKDGSVSSR